MGQESEGVYYTSERGNPPIGGERSCLTVNKPLKDKDKETQPKVETLGNPTEG